MSRLVTSPAGESVEILSDDEWCKLTDVSPNSLRLQQARRTILSTLWHHGSFSDPKGFAMRPFHEAATAMGYKASAMAMNGIFRDAVMAPAVERDVNGKRTRLVRLAALPQHWLDAMQANGHHAPKPEAVATPEPAPEETPEPEPMPSAAMDSPLELQISSTVAMALLAQVVEIISTGQPHATNEVRRLERELTEVSQRLSERLADNDRLRRNVRELQDELAATKTERDGLRQRLHLAESNLAKATSQDTQRLINERVRQELDKVMRAKPSGTHGRDDA